MNKASLRRLNVEELRNELGAAKSRYYAEYAAYAHEKNIPDVPNIKMQVIRGKGSKLKEQIIEQITRYDRETIKVGTKLRQIKLKMNLPTVKSLISINNIKIDLSSEGFDSNKYRGGLWAAIKMYKDYVKRGLIKEVAGYDILQSEEKADYAFNIMSKDDFYKYLNEANDKAAQLEAKYKQELNDPRGEKRFREKYGF